MTRVADTVYKKKARRMAGFLLVWRIGLIDSCND